MQDLPLEELEKKIEEVIPDYEELLDTEVLFESDLGRVEMTLREINLII